METTSSTRHTIYAEGARWALDEVTRYDITEVPATDTLTGEATTALTYKESTVRVGKFATRSHAERAAAAR